MWGGEAGYLHGVSAGWFRAFGLWVLMAQSLVWISVTTVIFSVAMITSATATAVAAAAVIEELKGEEPSSSGWDLDMRVASSGLNPEP